MGTEKKRGKGWFGEKEVLGKDLEGMKDLF